ncbi:hypothetical protein K502DRAFT_48160 [Neoconidiobolus thromboides FSU 785]|nr:hypothetical protein K502DRAFT_48160 [Neoconidiobolus thromboides FSU 785]
MSCVNSWEKLKFKGDEEVNSLLEFKDKYHQVVNNTNENNKDLFIVLIRDSSRIDNKELNDFLRILNSYNNSLPLLIMMSQNLGSSINNLINDDLIYNLSIESFNWLDANQSLNIVIENYFITNPKGIRLSPRMFNWIVENFMDLNHSIKSFLNVLKFIHMEYFYCNPLNQFYIYDIKDINKIHELKLNKEDIYRLRSLNSVKLYIENKIESILNKKNKKEENNNELIKKEKEKLNQLMKDNNYFINELLIPSIKEYLIYQQKYPNLIQCLLIIINYLKLNQITLIEIYYQLLMNKLIDSSFYLNNIHHNQHDLDLYECEVFIENLAQTTIHDDDIQENIIELRNELEKNEDENKLKLKLKILLKKLIDYLNTNFQPQNEFLFYELFIFDNLGLIQKNFLLHFSNNINFAIKQEEMYYPVETPINDMKLCFNLYLEAGYLININDWLKAYTFLLKKQISLIEPKIELEEEEINARFCHCLNELKFLGFIKYSKKKTDHVQKLIWIK